MPVGTCRLCLNELELRDSHIVPKWAYKRIRQLAPADGDSNPVVYSQGSVLQTSEQVREHMLCGSCEQMFCAREDVAAKLAYQADETCPLAAAEPITFLRQGAARVVSAKLFDWRSLVYFAVSVIWRASVAVREDTGKPRLGPKYEELFRTYLLRGQDLPREARLLLGVFEYGPASRTPWIKAVTFPSTDRLRNHHVHTFIICGLYFRLAVGSLVDRDQAAERCFFHSPAHPAVVAPPEMFGTMQGLRSHLAAGEAGGKVSARRARVSG